MLLAGPSGAGKSTLLRAMAGVLLTADSGDLSGDVLVGDRPAGSRAGQAGLLLQDPADAMVAATVGRDVAFGPENVAADRREIWRRVAESLAGVDFPYSEAHPTGRLSGGEGQRLALAGAVALRPGLLLLDEPTAMLDPPSADAVRAAVLAAVAAGSATLVVVEHHLEAWLPHVDRVIVLSSSGRIIADGPPVETLKRYADVLAAQGVWLPGLPDPEPLELASGLAGPWRSDPAAMPGSSLLEGHAIGVPGRLAPVSLTLAAGDVTAITGRSGAGKSTLLATLAGLLRPGGGRVVARPPLARGLAGDPVEWRSRELAQRVGWVGQHPEPAFVARSVREEVLAGLRGDLDDPERPTAAARARADGLLLALGLSQLATADPCRLSGGEQRRLAVAAALAQGPQVLLFDEPTLGQDRSTWAAVAGAIRAARDGGSAIAVATHDRRLVRALADAELALSAPAPHLPRPGADNSARAWPPARHCGPLAIGIVSLLALVSSVFVRTWHVGVVTLAVILLLAPLTISSLRSAARRALPGALAALSIGWSTWLLGNRDVGTAVAAGLRILILVWPGSLLTAHLDTSRLGDDLAQRLRLPDRPVVAAVAALQRIEDLGTIWSQAAWARRVRGLAAGGSPVGRVREIAALTFNLLVQTVRRSGRMAVAMDARGFAGARDRSWAEPSVWRRSDTILLAIGLAVGALPIMLNVTWM